MNNVVILFRPCVGTFPLLYSSTARSGYGSKYATRTSR